MTAHRAAFRWGLLGAARISRALIPAIRAAGGEVAALGVREPDSARARAFAREWNVPLVGDYAALLAQPLDAVYIPLPHDAHFPWTLRALEAGKHALTEKPLTLNAEEARALADAAQRRGLLLQEAFAYRFGPQVTRLLDLVRGGELGQIRALHGSFGFRLTHPDDFRWRAEHGGGALYDVGCYPVNLARLLLGEPQSVTAEARWSEGGAEGGVDLGFSGTLHYPGALVGLSCGIDWTDPPTQRLTVVGERGTLDLDGAFESHPAAPLTLRRSGGVNEVIAPANGYARMVAHFQRAARGEEEPLFPPEDAVAGMRVLDALFLAARSGQRVTV